MSPGVPVLFLIQLLITVPGKAEEDGQSIWNPDPCRRSWLKPGPDLAVAAIWTINEYSENLFLLPSVVLSLKKINISF